MVLFSIFAFIIMFKRWSEIKKDEDKHVRFDEVVMDLHTEIERNNLET